MTQKIAKFLAGIVLLFSYLVILDAYMMAVVLPVDQLPWLQIGFSDGIAFFFTGIICYAIAGERGVSNIVSDLMLPASVLIVFLLVSTMTMSSLLALSTDISILFSADELLVLEQSQRLLPWGEVAGYMVIALAGLNGMFALGETRHRQLIVAGVLCLIQIAAVIGLLTDMPLWAGEIAGFSRASRPLMVGFFTMLSLSILLSSFPLRRSSDS